MENFDRKKHWENIYQTKDLKEVSWFQPIPKTSLDFVEEFNLPLNAKIIDVGGGDSFFVDSLLDKGFVDITVLDISASSLERAKKRLGERANAVKWIVADASSFKPNEQYDFWHDRAAFHFLTQESEIDNYINTVRQNLTSIGILVIGTFSEEGPQKCSGINIKQYSEVSLTEKLAVYFKKIRCVTVDHVTPFKTLQNFVFCSFKKLTTS